MGTEVNSFPIPDFIVVGAQIGDEVFMLASKTLTSAELRKELRGIDRIHYRDYPFSCPLRYDITITAEVKDYVMVRGKDYAEAWQTLFKTWSPTPPEREELSGRKILP